MDKTAKYIIEKVAPIFNKKGYIATSMSDLCKATNLTKGALYCNFKNKEEIAINCFKYNLKQSIVPLQKKLMVTEKAIDKLFIITNYYKNYYKLTYNTGGCPIMNISIDAKFNNSKLYSLAKKESENIMLGLNSIILKGIENKEIIDLNAKSYAINIHNMIQGAVFMSFTQEDPMYLATTMNYIENEIISKIKL